MDKGQQLFGNTLHWPKIFTGISHITTWIPKIENEGIVDSKTKPQVYLDMIVTQEGIMKHPEALEFERTDL